MTIRYDGSRAYGNNTRSAVITYKNGKENAKAEKIMDAIENNGYRVNLIDCDDTTEIYIKVWDKDEYEEVKEIYLEAKTA